MQRKLVQSLAILLVLGGGPLFAGAVYVPVPDTTVEGLTFVPQIYLTNQANAKRTFTRFAIPQDTDGVKRAGKPENVVVLGGHTGVFQPVAGGLVELGGVSDMAVGGILVGSNADSTEATEIALPVITSANLGAVNDTLQVLGLQRDAIHVADLYIVNLGASAASCKITVLSPTGAVLIPTTSQTFKPLSMRRFADALANVADGVIDNARAAVSCDQEFYAFAFVASGSGVPVPFASVMVPAGTGASSLLVPGSTSGEGCQTTSAAHCYFQPGLVFTSQKGANQKRLTFPVKVGQYKKARLRMDVYYAGPNPRNPGGLQQFFWMAINNKNIDLLAFTATKDRNATLMLRAGIGLLPGDKSKIERSFSMRIGETYTHDYVYDCERDEIVWNIFEQSTGKLVMSVFDQPNVRNVNFGEDGVMSVDLSMSGVNEKEPPSHGWKYSNVLFEMYKR
jgi:hypothetical protein